MKKPESMGRRDPGQSCPCLKRRVEWYGELPATHAARFWPASKTSRFYLVYSNASCNACCAVLALNAPLLHEIHVLQFWPEVLLSSCNRVSAISLQYTTLQLAFNNSLIGFLITKSALQINRLLLLCYLCHMTFMSGIKIIGIFLLILTTISPKSALADWKIYYTGIIGQQSGYHGRGSFATQSQCEQYRMTMPGGSMSYCGGFDTPTPSSPSGDDGTAAREQEKQRQLQLQREQQERELELARQKKFAEEKDKLLGSFKGNSTGTLGLKTGTGSVSGCIEKGLTCVLNGTPCCAPYSCSGKFPNTYCGSLNGTDTLGLKTGTGSVDPKVLQEQNEFEKMNAEWMEKQKQLIEQRLREPNKYAAAITKSLKTNAPAITKSLKTNAPPLPWKTFNELQAGDVLLMEGEKASKGIVYADNKLSGGNPSNASHTVVYLKEVRGKKLFLDNQPNVGPRIISEEEFKGLYGNRGADVAKLAQPLNKKEGQALFSAAVAMAQKNNQKLINKDTWFGKYLLNDTNYGPGGKDDVVCSETDWAVINAAGRTIPFSDNKLKLFLGLNFTPSDFYNSPYFLVTPLVMPK
ncbi:MAG: hypothetical protein NT010_00970 [Proteobacteria bacterium]|nr:hypothetical protein [Pseudomonadota bacterium]